MGNLPPESDGVKYIGFSSNDTGPNAGIRTFGSKFNTPDEVKNAAEREGINADNIVIAREVIEAGSVVSREIQEVLKGTEEPFERLLAAAA